MLVPIFNTRRPRAQSSHSRGFTLLETIVVVGIIVLLAGLLFAYAGPMRERARRAATKKLIESTYNAIEQYRIAFRNYPPDNYSGYVGSQALVYFLTNAFRRNPVVANGEILSTVNAGPFITYQPSELMDLTASGKMSVMDAWRTPVKYVVKTQVQKDVWDAAKSETIYLPFIYSYGPNRIDDNGTNDDIILGK